MFNRREFIGASLASVLPALGAPGDKMRFAMSANMWGSNTQEAITTTARFGFSGLEPFRHQVLNYINQPKEVLQHLLDESQISLVTIATDGGDYLNPTNLPETIDGCVQLAQFVRQFNCTHFKVNPNWRPDTLTGPNQLSNGELKSIAHAFNEVGRRIHDLGLKFAFHPHDWTIVESGQELMQIMEMTDPKLVYLVMDTGHLTLAGIDPVQSIRDYYSRVVAIHFKETWAKYATSRGWRGPSPTKEEHKKSNLYKPFGAGGVDFQGVMNVLRERKFDGWITLDVDSLRPGEGTIEESMAAYRKFLIEQLNVRLRG